MHVHFVGEPDDGQSVSSHHAHLIAEDGASVSFGVGHRASEGAIPSSDSAIVHVVTGFQRDFALLRNLVKARGKGVAVFRYWRPPDVLWAKHHGPSRRFAHTLQQLGAHQAVGSVNLADELSRIGIDAKPGLVADRIISSAIKPQPLPKQFTVTCYLPTGSRSFYGGDVVDQLIERLPKVRWLVLGDHGRDYSAHPHVESLGFVEDINRALIRTTATIHPVAHEGVSRLALESMCHGRHVVASFDLPHAHRASTPEQFYRVVRDMCGVTRFNLEGREHVCHKFDRTVSQAELQHRLTRCHDQAIDGGILHAKWVTTRAKMRFPAMYSRRQFAPPTIDSLPENARAMKLLLEDRAGRPDPAVQAP